MTFHREPSARPVRPERNMLFVPGSDWAKVRKAAASDADAVCIDLEDSVPREAKIESRLTAIRAFSELDFGARVRMVRINGLDTEFAYRDLIEIVEPAGQKLDLVMIPKVASAGDVLFVDRLLSQIEWHFRLDRPIGIEAQIETAAGFIAAREIAASSPRLEALCFGPGDFAASMQMPSSGIGEFDAHHESYAGHRWHAVMQTIVASARANGLRSIDGPYANYKDASGFERSCRLARALGFEGKQCIHPHQLPIAKKVFTLGNQEVEQAEEIVKSYERAVARGQGAVGVKGQMIDAATVRLAQVTLEKHAACRRGDSRRPTRAGKKHE